MKQQQRKKFREATATEYPRAPFPMCFTEAALEHLLATVGTEPPETGAKGFGPQAVIGFDVVEFDEAGSANANEVVYKPNTEWGSRRQAYHLNQPGESMRLWSGDLHSHPGGFGTPSSKSGKGLGDLGYVEEVFAYNEWMQWFLMPIITGAGTEDVAIHPWVIERGQNGSPPTIYIAEMRVCDVSDFPARLFNPEWEKAASAQKKIEDEEAKIPEKQTIIEAYASRTRGIVSPEFRKRTIAVVGIGAGSYMVEKLVRLCPGRVKICDPDRVEVANLSRTAYTFNDAQTSALKVDALAARLKEVNPFVPVGCFPQKLNDMTTRERREFFRDVDLIIAGTDDFDCQALCNEIAVLFSIPAIFIGIHAGADGGRIVWCLPDETPCYCCVAHDRFVAAQAGTRDKVNLAGAHGSLVDTQFIDMIATKIAVALLERGQDSASGRFFSKMKNRSEIICRCSPDYAWGNALWDALLGDLPKAPRDFAGELKDQALFAMDSIWLKGEFLPGCPVCGKGSKNG